MRPGRTTSGCDRAPCAGTYVIVALPVGIVSLWKARRTSRVVVVSGRTRAVGRTNADWAEAPHRLRRTCSAETCR